MVLEANEADLLEVRQIASGEANRAVPGTENAQPSAVRIKPIYKSSVHQNLAAAALEEPWCAGALHNRIWWSLKGGAPISKDSPNKIPSTKRGLPGSPTASESVGTALN